VDLGVDRGGRPHRRAPTDGAGVAQSRPCSERARIRFLRAGRACALPTGAGTDRIRSPSRSRPLKTRGVRRARHRQPHRPHHRRLADGTASASPPPTTTATRSPAAGDLRGRRHRLGYEVDHRATGADRTTEVPTQHTPQLLDVLHGKRTVEPVLSPHRVDLLGRHVGAVCAEQRRDRITGQREQDDERDGVRRPEDDHGLSDTSGEVAGHHVTRAGVGPECRVGRMGTPRTGIGTGLTGVGCCAVGDGRAARSSPRGECRDRLRVA
jgi:hypothetical protein